MSGAHEILIIEDDPATGRGLAAMVRARGWVPTVAFNARDAAKIVSERDFCGGLVDLRLPSEPDAMALALTGFTLIRDTLRVRFGRFDEKTGEYVVPLVVVSAEADPESISTALELGADAFVAKTRLGDPAYVMGKLEERLRIAGRADHAACGRLATAPPVSGGKPMCTIVIDGRKRGSRTLVRINGEERELSSGNFLPFLRLSAMSMRHRESWGEKVALGFGKSTAAPSRLRQVFDGLVPDDFGVIEWDRKERFRWSPLIAIERIDWEVLALHSDGLVRKLAAEWLGTGEKKGRKDDGRSQP
jgi:CheY-like chemotaxis protein